MSNLPIADAPEAGPGPFASEPTNVIVGNVALDLSTYRVSVGSHPANLSYQEFELLRVLAASPDRVASFASLSNFLWGTQGQRENRRLNVLVCRLRSKLADSAPYRLETVRGRGYGLLCRSFGSEPEQGSKGGAS
jgi:DNA-binding response OmpR family regulator